MPYNPAVTPQGDRYIAAAGSSIANDISSWLKDSREQQRQKEFNVGLATQLSAAGKISPEDLQSFLKANPDKQGGILTGIARQEAERLQSAQIGNIQSETAARNTLLPAQIAQTQAQAGNLQSETNIRNKAGQPVTVVGSDGVPRLAGFSTANGGIDSLPAQLMKRDLPPGQISELRDPQSKKLMGYQVRQPDGKIDVHTIGNDPFAALQALTGIGGAPAAPTAPAVAPAGRVLIYKNGQPAGTVPANQLQQALSQGYTQSP